MPVNIQYMNKLFTRYESCMVIVYLNVMIFTIVIDPERYISFLVRSFYFKNAVCYVPHSCWRDSIVKNSINRSTLSTGCAVKYRVQHDALDT